MHLKMQGFLGAMLLLLASPASANSGATQGSLPGAPTQVETVRELYLFQYSPGPMWREGVPMREQGLGGHARYMQQLHTEGRLFAGGGYASDDGGMAIVVAEDIEEAQAILAADPAITEGIFIAALYQWTPRFRVETPLPGPF